MIELFMPGIAGRWRLLLIGAISVLPMTAQALALGQARVQSTVGEPLRIEIELPQITPAEAASLRVGVAAARTYASAGLDDNPVLREVRISLNTRPDGRSYLVILGATPIYTPVVDLLLEASTTSGVLVRDYSLSLRPGKVAAAAEGSQMALGAARVLSRQGEPLHAEVEVPVIGSSAAASLRVVVASLAMFRAAGLEFHPALSGVSISLHQRANGRAFLRLRGSRPVDTGLLQLLLDVSWEGGQLQRDYDLDVPAAAASTSVDVQPGRAVSPGQPAQEATPITLQPAGAGQGAVAVAAAPAAATTQQSAAPATVPAAVKPASAASATPPPAPAQAQVPATGAPAAPAAAVKPTLPAASASQTVTSGSAPARQVRVRPGDTASRIASAHAMVNTTIEQMLVGMLRRNPSAFMDGNVNRLKAGPVLDLPSAQEAAAVGPDEARRIIETQNASFADLRRKAALGVQPVQIPAVDRAASGAAAELAKVPGPDLKPSDRLTLSSRPGASGPGARLPAPAPLARKAETLADQVSRQTAEVRRLQAEGAATPASAVRRSSPAAAASAAASGIGRGGSSTR